MCASLNNAARNGDLIRLEIAACVEVLYKFGTMMVESRTAAEMFRNVFVFSGVVSTLLTNISGLETADYLYLLASFGERVLGGVVVVNVDRGLSKFNCNRVLADHYYHWRNLIVSSDVLPPGWEILESSLNRLGCIRRDDDMCRQIVLYDFQGVVARSCEMDVHSAYFRYLVQSGQLSILSLRLTLPETSPSVNATMIDDRRGSRDSVVSLAPQDSHALSNSCMFGFLCRNFVYSFGSQFLDQLANDLLNSWPRSVVEECLTLRVCRVLLVSIRRIFTLQFRDPFQQGFAFLVRAELVSVGEENSRAIGALMTCVLALAKSRCSVWLSPKRTQLLTALLKNDSELLHETNLHLLKKTVKSIYREIAANSSLEWESVLKQKLSGWFNEDLQKLQSTAHAMGITPIDIATGHRDSVECQPTLVPDHAESAGLHTPVPPDQANLEDDAPFSPKHISSKSNHSGSISTISKAPGFVAEFSTPVKDASPATLATFVPNTPPPVTASDIAQLWDSIEVLFLEVSKLKMKKAEDVNRAA